MAACRPSGLSVLCSLYRLYICMLFIHVPRAHSLSFDLSFSKPQSPDLSSQKINFNGDAYPTPETLELTRNQHDQSSTNSIGRATYAQPVPLWDGATGETASFTTTFTFRIRPDSWSPYPGDGMAFFLGHYGSDIPVQSGGGMLGLVPTHTNGTGNGTVVAVEFDTFQNPTNDDISSNHVGIDVDSLNSTASTDTTSPTKNLTSGYLMAATVRYENVTRLLALELTVNDTSYYVNATVDLKGYLPERVAVGFSAATGNGGEQHQVLSWSFTSTLPEPPAPAPAPPPHATPDNNQPPKKKRSVGTTGLIIAVLVPLLSLLACAAGVLARRKLRGRRRRRPPNGSSDDDNDYQEQDNGSRAELERGVAATGPRRYAYRDLAAATDNFAEDGKLGRGGFGSVYRGKLTVAGEERPVAIKVLSSESSAQGRKEFEAEVRIISRLKHRNLVQLLGWCDSRHGLLLVYELVAQGSLDRHLHGSERFLAWPDRHQIILGLGSALRYLHQEWEQRVVHGDIKPSNIMLDDSLGAKLGDFGLARLGDHGGRWHTTKAVLGTAGYIDPEFVNTRHPSTHADVYSFGIVLLEVVSGRSPVVLLPGEPPFVLLKWVWGLYGRNAVLDAADEQLRGGGDDDECIERALVVGLWCAHPEQSERPSIAQAMHVLQSADARLPALPPQMYKTASDLAVTGRSYGVLSVESYSGGDSSTTTTTAGYSKTSSGSSTTALLRDSKERP
ncbi:protein kinase [Zea mays]|uniref:non-specific serine/threonine protein kinase n=2 Tax=Zea mays TaxID=4577 RepID=B6SVB5_MAIZE|nr:protein kinase [Zea mays]ACG28798.1 protein kinase [Zea mays]ACG30069.1 protein kinase [Zea mays]ACN34522.1 unknown [Zea mays]ONM42096.1 L-type lectin-domain containing receptor kinase IX.1 [Zea mays]|eukprot:NP_001148178.1 protein kinase [Zea mays]